MRRAAFGFVAGAIVAHQLPVLPPQWLLWGLLAAALVWLRRAPAAAALLLGVSWTLYSATTALGHRLPAALEGEDVAVVGRITDFPRRDALRTAFVLAPERMPVVAAGPLPRRLRLSWYGDAPALEAGSRWRLIVRLKRPHGLHNPGGFDYEGWLFQQQVDAVGYVRQGDRAQRLDGGGGLHWWRQRLAAAIASAAPEAGYSGILVALAVGDRRGLSDPQWQLLADTGTSHLLAISGLHVGLVFGFGFILASRLWRASSRLCGWLPAPLAGTALGLAAAAAYAALAGFALPTQRALVMLAVAALGLAARRRLARVDALLLAAVGVLLLDPFAPLGAGFWLSFLAVAAILALGARSLRGGAGRIRLQVLLSLALCPVVALWFGQLPWVSPLANLLAIPVVGLVVVPLDLAAVSLLGAAPGLAALLLRAASAVLDALFAVLQWLQGPGALRLPELPLGLVLLAALGALLLLAPAGLPGRRLSWPLLALLLLYRPVRPPAGEAWLTVLDVGQGLAVAVETRRRVLIYDTGPRLGARLDAGRAAVVPYLQARGWASVERLVISHADSDHAAGARSLARALPVAAVEYGEAVAGLDGRPCRRGRRWSWDGVRFAYLRGGTGEGNAASCVLRIDTAGGSALLTGDIEAPGERALLAQGAALQAQLLIAPHHGSASSSTPAFVAAVAPQAVVYAVGYRNRWGFPRPQVQARYRAVGARAYRTAEQGALRFRLPAQPSPLGDADPISRHRYFHR